MSDIEQLTTELENTQIAYQIAQEINQLGSLGIMVINKTNQRKRQEASYVNCQNW